MEHTEFEFECAIMTHRKGEEADLFRFASSMQASALKPEEEGRSGLGQDWL